jgi:hypothetical protein
MIEQLARVVNVRVAAAGPRPSPPAAAVSEWSAAISSEETPCSTRCAGLIDEPDLHRRHRAAPHEAVARCHEITYDGGTRNATVLDGTGVLRRSRRRGAGSEAHFTTTEPDTLSGGETVSA